MGGMSGRVARGVQESGNFVGDAIFDFGGMGRKQDKHFGGARRGHKNCNKYDLYYQVSRWGAKDLDGREGLARIIRHEQASISF